MNGLVRNLNSLDSSVTIAKSFFPDLYVKNSKDIFYQLFKQFNYEHECIYEKALQIRRNPNSSIFDSMKSVPIEAVWSGFIKALVKFTKNMVGYVKNLPGFDEFNSTELLEIIDKQFFALFGLSLTKCFMNNEDYYLLADNTILFSRSLMYKTFGNYLCDLIFDYHYKLNSFCLSDTETALVFPILLLRTNGLNFFFYLIIK